MSEVAEGTLPEGWTKAAMVDLAEVNPKKIKPAYADDLPVVFVPMASVAEESRGIDIAERRPFAAVTRGYSQFQPNDVLFAKITPCMENGKVAVVPDIEPPLGYGSTEFFVLRPRADGTSVWIARYVSQARFRRLAQENMQGAVGQLRVPKVWLENAEIPLAPFTEQHRIVARVEALFAKLDEAIAALRRAQANLDRYRASVLKGAVEGRLTAQWRSENPPEESGKQLLERILAERRKRWEEDRLAEFAAKGRKAPNDWKSKYKEPVAPATSGLPELPEGWCWATVDQIGHVGSGMTKGGSKREAARRPVPYLRVANVQRGSLDLSVIKTIMASDEEIRRYSLAPGDVLFNEGGDRDKLGRGCVWRGEIPGCLHQNHVFRVRLFVQGCSSELLSHYGNSMGREWFFQKATQSVNLASINQTALRSLPVPLAPLREQAEVVRRLADALGTLGFARTAIGGHLDRAAALRQSILKSAFEGRLVPQDPSDEPAAVLLERIRDERKAERRQAASRRRTHRAARGQSPP